MKTNVTAELASPHPVLPDVRTRMARADVRSPDIDWMAEIGAAIQQAVRDAKWSNKEAAARAKVDDAEFGKWLNGTRRPQFDKLLAVPELRKPLVIAIAKLAGDGIEIETSIRIRSVA